MNREFTFTRDDRQEVVDALKEIFLTPIGEDYKRNYHTAEHGDEDCDKILDAAERIAGGPNITVQHMARALRLLIDAGEIKRKDFEVATPLEEPAEDNRPRDKNGKLLSESQLYYREYREFSQSSSMAEISRRKQTDAGYASYVRRQLAAEMNQPIDGAVTPVGEQNLLPRHTADQSLIEFARKYQCEPSQNLRPRGGVVLLAGEQIPYATFLQMVDKATAARLI